MSEKRLRPVTASTMRWEPDLDLVRPINGADIPNFREWVNWSGWKGYANNHLGHDFAAYLTKDGKCVLGLPKETPIRAVANGKVLQVGRSVGAYGTFINIEHSKSESVFDGAGMSSAYHHVDPLVKTGQNVKKGDIIATLHKDEGEEEGALVHLHFELLHAREGSAILSLSEAQKLREDRSVDPALIFPQLAKNRAEPQGQVRFEIPELVGPIDLVIAHFKKLKVDNE